MQKQIKVVLLGAGNRADVYGKTALRHPDRMQVVGIVDPDPVRRELMREKYAVDPTRCYADVSELVAVEKFADAVINGTMDHLHVQTSIPVLEKGYDLLLEKPFAVGEAEMEALLKEIYAEEIATDVIHEAKPNVSELHPTMKPMKLIARQIRNSSQPGEAVLDLFGGSGTTLIACEQMDRRCFMMEYDPHYADVIVDRWEQLTGLKALKVNGYTAGGGYLKTA